ncbi:DNA-binding protein, partial [Streptomyces cavourensis]
VAIGAASRRVAKSLSAQKQSAAAVKFAMGSARRLHADLAAAGPLGLSTLGMLYLSAAIAASSMERTPTQVQEAIEHVDLADEVADQQGADLNADWTNFGPTNVGLHRVDVLARFEDGWSALEAADGMDGAAVRGLKQERRAGHLITMARAQLLTRKKDAAAKSLVEAARLAPEEFKGRPATVNLVKDVVGATARPSSELRALAERCGLQA